MRIAKVAQLDQQVEDARAKFFVGGLINEAGFQAKMELWKNSKPIVSITT